MESKDHVPMDLTLELSGHLSVSSVSRLAARASSLILPGKRLVVFIIMYMESYICSDGLAFIL